MIELLPQDVHRQLGQLDLVVRSTRSVPEIPDALNQTVLFGGKRLRPTLCFLMGKILGVAPERLATFARAAEFTHSASLAHDDVLDSAETRRERKTLNAATSNARAVLAGDMLLARVMVELSQAGNLDIIHDLALVVEDLVNGEWLQLEARGKTDVTWDHLLEVARRKTASLMSWCCVVAARTAAPENRELIDACRDFGSDLGVAFQMVDDVVDFELGTGKDFNKDFKDGLINFVVADLIKNNPRVAVTPGRFAWTEEQLGESMVRVREAAQAYLERAKSSLAVIRSHSDESDLEARQALAALDALFEFLQARRM